MIHPPLDQIVTHYWQPTLTAIAPAQAVEAELYWDPNTDSDSDSATAPLVRLHLGDQAPPLVGEPLGPCAFAA